MWKREFSVFFYVKMGKMFGIFDSKMDFFGILIHKWENSEIMKITSKT